MKFLHTADWQIGMKAAHVGDAGKRVREERLATLRKLIEVAGQQGVEFILVAGDTFEDNGVDRIMIQKVANALESSNVPVYIIPGNHDPFVPGSVWEHPVWKSHENMHVLCDEEPVEVNGGLLYPCPVLEKHSRKDPTAWIRALESQAVQVGVAHGTVEGLAMDEPDYPIPRVAATRAGLDYLALGHCHSYWAVPSADGVVQTAYSGTHEATKFGESDSGNVLIVEIARTGAAPVITPVRVGSLEWRVIESDLRQPGDLARLREKIEQIEGPAQTLIDLRVRGVFPAEDRGQLARLQEIVATRFLWGRVDDTQVRPSPDDENWVGNLPVGTIREAGVRLRELADSNFTGERPEGVSPETASRALMELYAILTEVAQ
jgi:DNA repair exonuclease SbcCD nuclease subunit